MSKFTKWLQPRGDDVTSTDSTGIPSDLLSELRARIGELVSANAGWQQLTGCDYDRERGSVHLRLANGTSVRLAVGHADAAEQVWALARLGDCRVRFTADGERLAVLASCAEWVYALVGTPALTA